MPTVSAGDASVHYEVTGNGPGLVLVHGTQGNGQTNWGHLAAGFADARTVITPDYSGSGLTTDGGGELTPESLAKQVVEVARDAADGPVDLLGFSLGSVVAAAAAALHPDLVRRLVLVAGWAHGEDSRHRLNFELWRDLALTDFDLFNRFGVLTGFSPAFLSMLGHDGVREILSVGSPEPGLDRQIALDLRADIRGLLPKITAPTLVVGLAQDQMVPLSGPRELHESIAGSRYAELDSGHLVLFERPDDLVALVRDFLLA